MTYNNFLYHLIPSSQEAESASNGFSGCNKSSDGNWLLCDKGDRDMCMWVDFDVDLLPQYLKDLNLTSCCIDHATALDIVRTTASTDGASDGWSFIPVEE